MKRNPILEEIYAAREQLLANYGGDVNAYLAAVREREAASGLVAGGTPQEAGTCKEPATSGTSATDNHSPSSGNQ